MQKENEDLTAEREALNAQHSHISNDVTGPVQRSVSALTERTEHTERTERRSEHEDAVGFPLQW